MPRPPKRILFFLAFSLLGAAPARSFAWGLHDLVTEAALSPVNSPNLSEVIQTENLDRFVATQAVPLAKLFESYYGWLEKKGSKRFKRHVFDAAHAGPAEFLASARFNPHTRFYTVCRLVPGEKPQHPLILLTTLSPYERLEKHYDYTFEDRSGSTMTAREILRTASDEPDWWIDGHLWEVSAYGYGIPPYGKSGSNSNDGAFHSKFGHEPWLIRKLAPEVQDGMADERVELMLRLSRLAFESGHRYWGYRFAAWGMHYLEDMSQPYHSRAVPGKGLWFYLRFAFSSEKARIKNETTQLVMNRHYLYEDFVKTLLQGTFVAPSQNGDVLAGALRHGSSVWMDLIHKSDSRSLFERVSSASAAMADDLDAAVVKAYGPRMTEDPSYDEEKDPQYDSQAIFERASAPEIQALVAEARKDLELTGIAARTFLQLCLNY